MSEALPRTGGCAPGLARKLERGRARTQGRVVLDLCEKERRRIGRDLHDSLGQQMVGLGMLVRNLVRRLQGGDTELCAEARRAVEIIDELVAQTRDLARGLYPVELEVKGLVPALRALAAQTSSRTGVRVEVRVHEKRPMQVDLERASHLFRIVQEALSNAVRHGQARSIVIMVACDQWFELSVVDDGRGIPPRSKRVDGMGVRFMAERASLIGATLTVTPAGTRGTQVRCVLPLRG